MPRTGSESHLPWRVYPHLRRNRNARPNLTSFFFLLLSLSAAGVSRRRNRRKRHFSVARKRFGSRRRARAVNRRLGRWCLAGVVRRSRRSRGRGGQRSVRVVRRRVEEAGARVGHGAGGFAAPVEAAEPLAPHPQGRPHPCSDGPQLVLLVLHRGLQPLPRRAQGRHLLLLGAALGLELHSQLFDLALFVHRMRCSGGFAPPLFQKLVAALLIGLCGGSCLLRSARFELLQLFSEARRLPLQLDRRFRNLIPNVITHRSRQGKEKKKKPEDQETVVGTSTRQRWKELGVNVPPRPRLCGWTECWLPGL